MPHVVTIHPSVIEHLGCFQFLTITDRQGTWMSRYLCCGQLFGTVPKSCRSNVALFPVLEGLSCWLPQEQYTFTPSKCLSAFPAPSPHGLSLFYYLGCSDWYKMTSQSSFDLHPLLTKGADMSLSAPQPPRLIFWELCLVCDSFLRWVIRFPDVHYFKFFITLSYVLLVKILPHSVACLFAQIGASQFDEVLFISCWS